MQRIAESTITLGFDQPIHPMRNKEAQVLPRKNKKEFYSRETRGVEISGAVLKAKKDTGGAATVFLPTRDSNVHSLFLIDSPEATISERIADTLPNAYVAAFNKDTQINVRGLPGLQSHSRASFSEALTTVSDDILMLTQPSLAFAHVVPKNGNMSHMILGLSENTLAIIIYPEKDGVRQETRIVTADTLSPTDIPGFRMDGLPLPTGAQLILTTALKAYQEHGGLEALTTFYEYSHDITRAIQALQKHPSQLTDLPPLSSALREHLLISASALSIDQPFNRHVKRGRDMAVAASLAAEDLATLAHDALGNPKIPERIAFIGSRIPQPKEPSTRRAA